MPTALRKLLWSLAALILILGSAEGLARWGEAIAPRATIPDPGTEDPQFATALTRHRPTQDRLAMVAEESRGWALEPGALLCYSGRIPIRINSLGFRGPEPVEPEPGELRLMPVGDSSCFGYAIYEEDTLGAVAAHQLAEILGRPVRETNACIPGYDSWQSLKALREAQPHLLPAWVIVTAMWSDIYRRQEGRLQSAMLETSRAGLGHLASYRQLRRLLAPLLRPREVRWILDRDDFARSPDGRDARIDLQTYAANLTRMSESASQLGARTLFLALPAPVDFDLVPPPETISLYREAMAQVAEATGSPFVDGPAWFKAHGADETRFVDQVHPNTNGHALLGQAVAEAIAAEAVPPPEAHHFGSPDLRIVPSPTKMYTDTAPLGECDVVEEAGVIPEHHERR